MKYFTGNISRYIIKSQNLETKKKLKELVLAKISRIPQISHII